MSKDKAGKEKIHVCSYEDRETIKAIARCLAYDQSMTMEERIFAQEIVFFALYARSKETSPENHPTFAQYIAMLLNQPTGITKDDLLQPMRDKYGTLPGIIYGTMYPNTKRP